LKQGTTRLMVCAAIALAAAAAPSRASADEPERPSPSTTEMTEAESRFREGLELYGKGSINEARVKLVQAYAVLGRTNILWNLAVAEFYSSRLLDAIRHMRQFVKAPDAAPDDVKLAKEQFIPAIEKQTGRVAITASRGTSISVDGEELGLAPLADAIDVLPGKHVVVGKGQSGTVAVEVEVRSGQLIPAKLANEVTAPPSGPPPGTALPYEDQHPLEPEREPSSTRLITTIVIGSGALVAAGIGVAFLALASSNGSDADSIANSLGNDRSACAGVSSSDCTSLREANDARNRDNNLATGFLIGAGVLAVGAAATYFFWPKAEPRRGRAGAYFVPAPGGGAGALHIAF
jgi:hypothetical protein